MTQLEREELISRFKAMGSEEIELIAELMDPQIMIKQIGRILGRYKAIESEILKAYGVVSNRKAEELENLVWTPVSEPPIEFVTCFVRGIDPALNQKLTYTGYLAPGNIWMVEVTDPANISKKIYVSADEITFVPEEWRQKSTR